MIEDGNITQTDCFNYFSLWIAWRLMGIRALAWACVGMDWIQDLSVLPRTRGQKFEITVPSGRERRECHLSGQSAREQSTIRTFVKELITSIIAILMIFIIIYAGVSMMVTLFVYPHIVRNWLCALIMLAANW